MDWNRKKYIKILDDDGWYRLIFYLLIINKLFSKIYFISVQHYKIDNIDISLTLMVLIIVIGDVFSSKRINLDPDYEIFKSFQYWLKGLIYFVMIVCVCNGVNQFSNEPIASVLSYIPNSLLNLSIQNMSFTSWNEASGFLWLFLMVLLGISYFLFIIALLGSIWAFLYLIFLSIKIIIQRYSRITFN